MPYITSSFVREQKRERERWKAEEKELINLDGKPKKAFSGQRGNEETGQKEILPSPSINIEWFVTTQPDRKVVVVVIKALSRNRHSRLHNSKTISCNSIETPCAISARRAWPVQLNAVVDSILTDRLFFSSSLFYLRDWWALRPVQFENCHAENFTRPRPLCQFAYSISSRRRREGGKKLCVSSTCRRDRRFQNVNDRLRSFLDFARTGIHVSEYVTAFNRLPYFIGAWVPQGLMVNGYQIKRASTHTHTYTLLSYRQ